VATAADDRPAYGRRDTSLSGSYHWRWGRLVVRRAVCDAAAARRTARPV